MYVYLGISIVVLLREFIKCCATVKNHSFYSVEDLENDEIGKNFIILEQRKIIEQMKTSNLYYKIMAKHYRKLYLWQK